MNFMSANERRKITEEARKVVEFNLEKYIQKVDEKATAASKDGKNETVIFINEADNKLNSLIGNRLGEFLKEKGYTVDVQNTGTAVIVNYGW